MRIGVDARSLSGRRGVARYTDRLLDGLAGAHPTDEWVLYAPDRTHGTGLAALAARENVRVRRHPVPSRLLFGAAALAGRPRLDRLLGGGLDVVWAPAPRPLALSRGVPFVLTVHDLSFEERPGDFTAYERLWHRLARPRGLAARASRIVVGTAVTGRALVERWGTDPERVRVVTPGVSRSASPDPALVDAMRRRRGLARPYLLAVGALEPRKDPQLLARAHARAVRDGLSIDLVFAGEGRLAAALQGLTGVHVLGHVDDAELDLLYAGAVALVMVSWLEGFGWPPLEAIARGIPAVVADLPVYDETLEGGALRIPAGDEVALGAALARIASDGALRERVVRAGRIAIERLTWERAVEGLHRALCEAARR